MANEKAIFSFAIALDENLSLKSLILKVLNDPKDRSPQSKKNWLSHDSQFSINLKSNTMKNFQVQR